MPESKLPDVGLPLWYNTTSSDVDEDEDMSDQSCRPASAAHSSTASLPEFLRPLFWEHPFDKIDFVEHYDFVVGRILIEGDWNAIRWLRHRIGDEALRDWIVRHEGRGLTPPQLRFWHLIVKLPASDVDRWLAERGPGWEDRVRR